MKMKSFFALLTAVLFGTSCQQQNITDVKIYEQPISIPTFQVGEPELNPMFYVPANYQGAQYRVYPYPLLDQITDVKIEKNYRGLFLENKYVKICVLPELGGRLYFAQDKTNNYDFIYYNHVIKPALIGMAGAWISGGVEWNIPHHHRVSTFMPVDFKCEENSDGSKTIWIGEYEKRHGSKWIVGLTLFPNRSFIQADIKLFNVTPEEQSNLIWANMAVHANENYQVIFPPDVEQAVFHSKVEFTTWPVSKQFYQGIDFTKGVDVSWWKNTTSPTSFFAWGSNMDFMGGIDHAKNAGTMLVGEHHTVPGKKFWNWGNNEVGKLWDQQMLTDSDGSYLELMMGAFSDNQPDYSWNDPYNTKIAKMYYAPIRNMNGIKNANKDFAVNVDLETGKANVQIYSTGEYDHLKLVLTHDKNRVYEQDFSITPAHPFVSEVKVAQTMKIENMQLAVYDKTGQELVRYQGEPKKNLPLPETYKEPKQPGECQTVDELYLTGLRLEQFYNPDYNPLVYYFEALKRDPNNILVNTQLGIYYVRHYDYEKAEHYLRVAVQTVTFNYTKPKFTEPLYYLGVCLYEQQRFSEAYDWLFKASWSHEWASPSFYFISSIDCIRSELDKALTHIDQSIQENANNIDARNLKCIILRHLQRYDESCAAAQSAIEYDPLDFIAMHELYQLSENSKKAGNATDLLSVLSAKMRDEPDNYLECAARYARAGFYEDAIQLLNLAVVSEEKKLQNPLIYYYLGFYYSKINNTALSRQNYQKGSELPIDYCFPHGRESARVLTTAVAEMANDANASYYLGNLYYDHRPDLAVENWNRAISLNGQSAVFYRNLAFANANFLDNVQKAVGYMTKAIELNPDDPLYLTEMDLYLSALNTQPSERINLFQAHPDAVQKSDETTSRFIILTTMLGRYDEAIEMLKQKHFHSAERFDVNLHATWVDGHILRGIRSLNDKKLESALADFNAVLEFPRNLEIARDSKSELAYYFIGHCYKLMGEALKATDFFNKSVEKRPIGGWAGGEWPEVIYSKVLAYRELGRNAEANTLLNEMITEGKAELASNPHAAWYTNSVERRSRLQRDKASACLRIALGYLGQDKRKQAENFLQKAREYDVTIGNTMIFK
jgi:tetratricopeptide (TPR) repeat protein